MHPIHLIASLRGLDEGPHDQALQSLNLQRVNATVVGGLWSFIGWLLIIASLYSGVVLAQQVLQPATVRVVLRTSLGDIVLALEKERAPITVDNFLRYVDQRRLDGCDFYRAMKLDEDGQFGLIQGGLRGNPKRALKPIAHESTGVTGLSHVNGAISMARADPGTAAADFFIMVGDVPSYDAHPDTGDVGYAVFGRVVEGMDVVHAILEQPRSTEAGAGVMKGQILANPVKILSARRTD
jgi:peptidyl-prolyl cis-trans isomerase A (cyclophilin A)